ncbi:MAG TPA: tRNA 2-thiocytidine(32) synthetase TtcA [Polyangiaceae bacterium]|nr:tRNA 2-thiocytidine(32) synthetase TtcA [Polyangiaceae bacterium]
MNFANSHSIPDSASAPEPSSPRPLPAQLAQLEKKLLGQVARASHDFKLLEPGDRVMVAVSGGKDSHTLLHLLRGLTRRAPFPFSIIAVNLDQKQPGFPEDVLPSYFEREGYEYRIIEEDTYSIVKEKVPEGRTTCSLCSRLRRGILYNVAQELGATKIALGHHRDDAIETLLLNQFYSGQLKAMPARLHSDDGRNVVIRPLIYCAEAEIAEYAAAKAFPIIPCNLCGSQENLKRQEVKELLATLERTNPKLRANLMAALKNVRASHLLDSSVQQTRAESDAAPANEDGHLISALELLRPRAS